MTVMVSRTISATTIIINATTIIMMMSSPSADPSRLVSTTLIGVAGFCEPSRGAARWRGTEMDAWTRECWHVALQNQTINKRVYTLALQRQSPNLDCDLQCVLPVSTYGS